MSRLVPEVIALDKGIDLQSAKIIAPKGSVLDSLNYEQVDFQGQKRIDGFTRYDGKVLASIDEYYVLELNATFTGDVGNVLYFEAGLFGVVLSVDDTTVVAFVFNRRLLPSVGQDIFYLDSTGAPASGTWVVVSINKGTDLASGADEHYTNLLQYQKALREQVGPLPGPVAGLHWFKDRLYAVAGMTRTVVNSAYNIYPNMTLTLNDSGSVATVAEAFDYGGGVWVVLLDTFNPYGDWTTTGNTLTVGQGIGDGEIGDLNTYVYPNPGDDIATFFEAVTPQQANEDDRFNSLAAGWVFNHLGWKVAYEQGKSIFGSLSALNQNISGLGAQGPTNEGYALTLRQNVVITNKQGQVEGWKDSDTSETFALDPKVIGENAPLLSEIDGETRVIYADAYISWNAETGTITAPGITTPALEARPANATVPYTGADT